MPHRLCRFPGAIFAATLACCARGAAAAEEDFADRPAPGGMVFPRLLIRETLQQPARDLTRFDLDFDRVAFRRAL